MSDSLVNPSPGPVMNSLISDTKVVCNEAIPNPITPVPIPITIPACDKEAKSITILNGTHLKVEKEKVNGDISSEEVKIEQNQKEESSMHTDASNESSLSPSEPMDCNSTPNISPEHLVKSNSSNEDVPMSETLVKLIQNFSIDH